MKHRSFHVLALFTIFLSPCLSSVAQTLPQVKPSQVSILVESLDKSISWYKEMLGCEVDNRYTFIKQKTKIAVLKLNDFYIELIQNQNTPPSGDDIHRQINAELCGFRKMGFIPGCS